MINGGGGMCAYVVVGLMAKIVFPSNPSLSLILDPFAMPLSAAHFATL